MNRGSRTVFAAGLALCHAIGAAAQVPVGPELQVNEYTTDFQGYPRVAGTPDGGFVVAWMTFGSSCMVGVRRFQANGEPAGPEVPVDSCGNSFFYTPLGVFVDEDGEFTIVWQDEDMVLPPAPPWRLFGASAQRFAADGEPLAGYFAVTPNRQPDQYLSADASPAGELVVARGLGYSASSPRSLNVRGFDDSGLVQWDFPIAENEGALGGSDVDVANSGDFVVAWRTSGTIVTQRFDSEGAPLGDIISADAQGSAPRLARNDMDGFLLVWSADGHIHARELSATGVPVGPQVRVDDTTIGSPDDHSVAAASDGSVVVAWTDDPHGGPGGGDGSGMGIRARTLSANGELLSSAFVVNSYTTGAQETPSVSFLANGDFVVAWTSEGSFGNDTSLESIQVRRFRFAFFADGFETGDHSRWVYGED